MRLIEIKFHSPVQLNCVIFRELNNESKESHDISDFDGLEKPDEIFDATDIPKNVNDVIAPRREKRRINLITPYRLKPIDLNHYTFTEAPTTPPPSSPEDETVIESKVIDLNHPCYCLPVREDANLVYECLHEYRDKGIVAEMAKSSYELLNDLNEQLEVLEKDHTYENSLKEFVPIERPFWKRILDRWLSEEQKEKYFGEILRERSEEVNGENIF